MDPQTGGNEEINSALAEFETKFTNQQTTGGAMEQQIDNATSYSSMPVEKTSKMVARIIKLSGGMIKNETQANYVLIALVVLMFALSIFFFVKGSL